MSTATHCFGNFILLLLLSIISFAGKHELLSLTFATCTVSAFIARVAITALINSLYRNAIMLSPVLQQKVVHQEMLSFSMEPQLRGPKVRDFIYLCIYYLFINDPIGSPII